MGSKIYVGNLSYNTNSSDLEQLFSQHGSVQSAEVIADRDTGRSKGFGFVQMGTDEEAQAAINALNGQEHDGRALTVNEAKPREDRPRSGGGGGGGGGGPRRGGFGDRGGKGGGGYGRSRYYATLSNGAASAALFFISRTGATAWQTRMFGHGEWGRSV
jgi:RNA recognition motif-containing protein